MIETGIKPLNGKRQFRPLKWSTFGLLGVVSLVSRTCPYEGKFVSESLRLVDSITADSKIRRASTGKMLMTASDIRHACKGSY